MDDEERLLSPKPAGEDNQVEKSLRPRSLDEFIGQAKVAAQATDRRGSQFGPPSVWRTAND